jgi:hypothetical protein
VCIVLGRSLATVKAKVMSAVQQPLAGSASATTVDVASSHVAMVSHPAEVVGLIDAAVRTVAVAG